VDVTVNGERRSISSLAELRACLEQVKSTHAEVWLSRESGEVLTTLVNGERAWLRYEGDAGFTSRDPMHAGPKGAMLEFHLSNGQRDEYPESWTIPTTAALRAVERLFISGDMEPSVSWHEDAKEPREELN
jgi:hypothetical protein